LYLLLNIPVSGKEIMNLKNLSIEYPHN